MAEQAVSALNAVKASQTRKARALLENARLQNQAADKPSLHEPAPATALAPIHPTAPSMPEARADGGSSDVAADKAESVIPKGVPPISATPTTPASGQPIAGQTAASDSNQPQAARGSIAEDPAGQDATRGHDAAHDAIRQHPGNPGSIPTAPVPVITNRTAAGKRHTPWSRPGLIAAVLAVAGLLGYQYLPDSADTAPSPEAPVTAQPTFGEPETQRATITATTGETGSAGESGSKDSLTWRPAMPPGEADQEAVTSREATPATDTLATPDAPAVDQPTPDSNGPNGVASLTPDSATPAIEPAIVEPAAGDTPQTGQRTAPRPPPRAPGYGYYPQQRAWPQPYNRPAYSGYPGR